MEKNVIFMDDNQKMEQPNSMVPIVASCCFDKDVVPRGGGGVVEFSISEHSEFYTKCGPKGGPGPAQ